ncbi:kinase [Murimonas intestini]|uniref:kinase n=1 Tax=Murimonas intestini TaxID=1337051 RepID=UPI0011DE0DD4|nr:kinase [Murimonas intestini]
MRLIKVQNTLKKMNLQFEYTEIEGCGSLDFEYRGLRYHIWEFRDGEWGVETNIRQGGKDEELLGEYEDEIVKILGEWK